MDKKYIALKGRGNIGKTTAIKYLIGSFVTFDYKVDIVKTTKKEAYARVYIEDKVVGITTRGDNAYCLEKDFERLGDDCNIYVCASRSKGQTIRFLADKNAIFIKAKGKLLDLKTEYDWSNQLYRAILSVL